MELILAAIFFGTLSGAVARDITKEEKPERKPKYTAKIYEEKE